MVLFFILILIIIFAFIYFFVLTNVSPIPYFPTQWADLTFVAHELLNQKQRKNSKYEIRNTKYNHVIIDLGAGTGTVIFRAAGLSIKTNTKFIAVEINPFLCTIMQLRRLLHPNRKNIQIIRADIFNLNIKKLFPANSLHTPYSILYTIYLYVGPYVWDSLIPTLKTAPKNTRFISYMYKIPGWEKRLKKTKKGVKKMYIYQF